MKEQTGGRNVRGLDLGKLASPGGRPGPAARRKSTRPPRRLRADATGIAALVAALLAAVLLAGCGFQLRGTAQLPFSTVYVEGAGTSPLGHEIRRSLRASNARVVDTPTAAQARLVIMSEIREKQILSLGGQGRVREYQLRYRIAYQLTDGKTTLIPPSEIVLKRDVSFNDTEVLAKEAEEALLYRDMQTDAVSQLIRRLQATKLAA